MATLLNSLLPTTQLRDIPDGYTETWEAPCGETIRYRPILGWYRDKIIDWFACDGRPHIQDALALHVVSGDARKVPLVGLMRALCWLDRRSQEERDAKNLADGVRLHVRHPDIAARACEMCKMWWYKADGTIYRRGGEKQRRPEGSPLPCDTKEGCPKGHWTNPQSFSDKNQMAYEHYLWCRDTGLFPDDPIVRRNARIIAEQERR